ncbi:excinuclease ABC subunit UvrA [Streptomyces sp. NPDC048172]|uniref:excinuclease ABC subunit UvrA n=1 Tax=Streptomyces sp. NPDC048172 TaxID=3365505 RepID=UPI00371C2529
MRRVPGEYIVVSGARENNLKGVTVRIPVGRLTVVTGVSGSGKSSLVFGTLAVESQRQLNEVYPLFVRNRMPQYERPKFEFMENLAPAIIVDQKPVGGGSRSTVGTMTEVHPVLRVLFSRYGEPSAGLSHVYSFNDPQGMCPDCEGLGRTLQLDLGKLLDEDRSLNEGAIRHPSFAVGTNYWKRYAEISRYEKGEPLDLPPGPLVFDPDKPLRAYAPEERELLLHGHGFQTRRPHRDGSAAVNDFEGVVPRFTRRFLKPGLESLNERERGLAQGVVSEQACARCGGARLNERALASRIGGEGGAGGAAGSGGSAGYSIADLCGLEVRALIRVLEAAPLPGSARPVLGAALTALRRVESVGLGYLTLDRPTKTLSGGEGQRLKTVRHLGSSLTGMTYVFDEPSVGLHARDVDRLNALMLALRDKGNTVLVVEHDRDVIAVADHVVDMGPGAGAHGGDIVFAGTVAELAEADTATGRRYRALPPLKTDAEVRTPSGALPVRDATRHNLRGIAVDFPAGVLTAVTGVAGSGKSTLVSGVFAETYPEAIVLDQSAVGISPRSTPASYTRVWDPVRRAYAREHGVDPGMFSFNSKGGCPECQGRGVLTMDMAFLEPVTTVCEVCEGRRYRAEVLEHRIGGLNVADLLELTVEEALAVVESGPLGADPAIRRGLVPLNEVGLGYLTLGRPLSLLSCGERQRIKLANHLRDGGGRSGPQGGVYVFDEPTTGLHMADIDTLLTLLDRLVDDGSTVVVVEHDLDVIKRADWIVDIGPEAGAHGGRVVFAGTPERMAREGDSHTAEYLRRSLPGR